MITMKTTQKNQLLVSIQTIFEKTKNSELKPEVISSLRKELKVISKYLNCSSKEAMYFAIILNTNFSGESASFKDIFEHLNISAIELIQEFDYIEQLISRNYLIRKNGRSRHLDLHTNKYFIVHSKVSKAIMNGHDCPEFKTSTIDSTIDLLEKINDSIQHCIDDEITTEELRGEVEKLVFDYKDFGFIKSINAFNLSFEEYTFIYFIAWKQIIGTDSVVPNQFISAITETRRENVRFTQSLFNGLNPVISNNLVEYDNSGFLNDLEFQISDKTIKFLENDNIFISAATSKNNDAIKPDAIAGKELFYNDKENEQLSNLKELLKEEKFARLTERLKSKNLPTSLNVLLYGGPGTGKTESVLQLAKSSGREIIKIDISKTKSKWFGDSEKLIKNIFVKYADYAKKCDLAPILFFNEADAILSKRNTNHDSSTRQTENAIQNILLEELENFEGIFFATTNLAGNLDSAFERRFLFKIEFSNPILEQRKAIWESKMPHLSSNEYYQLSEKFELSGGQIDNIVRKYEIQTLLFEDEQVDFNKIIAFCDEEVKGFRQNSTSIGFNTKL